MHLKDIYKIGGTDLVPLIKKLAFENLQINESVDLNVVFNVNLRQKNQGIVYKNIDWIDE